MIIVKKLFLKILLDFLKILSYYPPLQKNVVLKVQTIHSPDFGTRFLCIKRGGKGVQVFPISQARLVF